MKFLVPKYSSLQNPWLGDYRPQIPILSVLSPQLNLLNPPKKIPGYATAYNHTCAEGFELIWKSFLKCKFEVVGSEYILNSSVNL